MGNINKKLVLALMMIAVCSPCQAESLFRTGVSENAYSVQPRSLFGSIRAKNIGDLITVVVDESVTTSDSAKLTVKDSSSLSDGFSGILNHILPGKYIPSVNGLSGGSTTGNSASSSRTSSLQNTITAQVVQIMPNGNLVIQGKKVALSGSERMEIILSGIVDPRFLDNSGQINSNNVANLQVAVTGRGTMARSNNEGPVNKLMKFFF